MRLVIVSVLIAFMAVFFWKYPRNIMADESEIVVKDLELQEAPQEEAPSLEPMFSEPEESEESQNQDPPPEKPAND